MISIDEEHPWCHICFVFFHFHSWHEYGVSLKCQSHNRKGYFLLFCSQKRRMAGVSSSPLCWDWEGSQLWKRPSWVRHISTGNDARDSSSSTLWTSIRKVVLISPWVFTQGLGEWTLVTHCLMASAVREGLKFSLQLTGQSDLSAHFPGAGEKNSPELHPQVPCPAWKPRGGACSESRAQPQSQASLVSQCVWRDSNGLCHSSWGKSLDRVRVGAAMCRPFHRDSHYGKEKRRWAVVKHLHSHFY